MHVAIYVDSIQEAIQYYQSILPFEVKYESYDWGLIQYKNNRIALLRRDTTRHEPHIGIEIGPQDLEALLKKPEFANVQVEKHRDGSVGFYTKDKYGNTLEFIHL
ncbi:MAG: VOC family protein [Bacteroidia bacterium]|nr:VOC family protein [Bacteroidia bacterium]MDW8301962.1 VOC family protein [Bacteroidia bacterium]